MSLLLLRRRGGVIVSDTFTRADSALTLGNAETGQAWTANAGTWGISSNQAYSVSDGDTDIATVPAVADGIFEAKLSGDVTPTPYRVVTLVFRAKDDATEYLQLYTYNSIFGLGKYEAAVASDLATVAATLTDDVEYTVRAVCDGNAIACYLDGVWKFTHTLAGGNTKFAAYTRAGVRLARAGTPTSNARFDTFSVVT